MSTEEYRRLLEACLADKIIEQAEAATEETARGDTERVLSSILRYEVNGLCMATRLLGDYGTTAFDLDWARRVTRPDVDWKKALDASYCRPIKRY